MKYANNLWFLDLGRFTRAFHGVGKREGEDGGAGHGLVAGGKAGGEGSLLLEKGSGESVDLIQRLRGFATEDGYKVLAQRISRPTRVASPFGSKTALFVRGVCGAPSCGSPTILCVGPYICERGVVGGYVLIIFLTRFQMFIELGLKKRVFGIQYSKRYSRQSVELVHNLLPFSRKQSPNFFFCLTS